MSERQSSIVLVLEKPSQAHKLAPLLATRWLGQRVFAIYTLYLGLYEFRYPRGLTFSDLPYTRDPVWKARKFDVTPPVLVVELVNGDVRKTDLEPAQVLATAETIWYGCDPDASGANAYQVLLTQCLGAESAALERPALFLYALDTASLQSALDAPSSTADPLFLTWLNKGEAKRFFDFNYNVNSLSLFGECLRDVGVDTTGYGLSKYSLQLLYAFKGASPITEVQVLRLMDEWPGTGRYGLSGLGSPASRAPILLGLIDVGLLERSEKLISLSARGHDFLGLLHPDCQDLDLPARLAEWQSQWPESRGKIERYLRTFFGKQLRYRSAL
ncbi:TPA: hypothetical protein NHR53_006199 [Pseudomonas aeruginosa]|uniref:hypothetical protein n=1 Tax=Pseudomonas aeruginosa TaxID=287 RepID=UPI000803BD0E|nr:hypothetical protein [Pseudomonas aeruginosa]OBY20771.1 hypothetical protein A8O37_25615 [Pseudomonas aeruginosa]HCE7248298.1 hypothetical protein [Pseudomonas aeruginosa]HCE8129602.1 hypothetical protein [Pseudomonas aeruginosa]HCF0447739.1 hypothetical protein [Pseudomonas aeruginosa]